MTVVRMVNSVAEYVAGEEYDLDEETADRFLALGYAEGDVSGDYGGEEWAAKVSELAAQNQTVSL